MVLDGDKASCMDGYERLPWGARQGCDEMLIARTDALVVRVCDVGQKSHRHDK